MFDKWTSRRLRRNTFCFLPLHHSICTCNSGFSPHLLLFMHQAEKKPSIVIAMTNKFVGQMVYRTLLADVTDRLIIASSGAEAEAYIIKTRPDIAFLDAHTEQVSGIEVSRSLRKLGIATRSILYCADHYAACVPYLLSKAINGMICQQCDSSDLFNCIREVKQGRFYITPYLAFYLEDINRPTAPGATKLVLLTKRESEVLGFIAKGYSNDQIAAHLYVSYRTIVNHKSNIVEKLALTGAHDLLPFALSVGHLL